MKPPALQLDFLRAPRSGWRWLGWCLLLLSATGSLAVVRAHREVAERHATVQSHHAAALRIADAAGARRGPAVPDPQVLLELRRANLIIDQLAVPWEPLFDAVEAADARELGLLSMVPAARDRSVRVTGEARNVPEVLAYVERLNAQPVLGQVHLVGHSNVQREGSAVVAFTLAATWRGQP